MRRWSVGVTAVAVVATTTASAAGVPHIVSVSSKQRHLVVAAQFGDLLPATVNAAVKPTTVNGALARQNIVYSARLDRRKTTTGSVSWRSPARLRRGTYWVQVTGAYTDTVPDCRPTLGNCATKYSNVVKVRIKK
jgi:hypothetical protein